MRAAPPTSSGEPKVLTLKANKSPSTTLALTNCVFLHPEDAKALTSPPNSFLPANNYVSVKDFVFSFMANNEITKGDIGFSLIQRNTATIGLNEQLQVASWCPREKNIFLSFLKIEVDFLAKNTPPETFKVKNLVDLFLQQFMHQCFTVEQKLVVELSGKNLCFRIAEIEVINFESISNPALTAAQPQQQKQGGRRGVLMKNTQVVFIKPASSSLKLEGDEGQGDSSSFQSNQIFRMDFSWEKLGIGGLDEELATVFRRAFASRIFPASLVARMGIKHVKGMLLFGPPGTGKTLIARQIGKLLNGKEPKVVSGPEILNKFVGQSEENVRLLFKDAEEEYKAKGDESQLHIIIFDEIDAICKARGSRGGDTGVGDSVVNQLLSKIDGVNSLNNILVIGMTNRKDMIDEALLRPGRLEVQMEIGLPDQNGRMQILRIHTATMTKNGLLDPDVNLQDLALRTKNFSGAEIEGLVKSAASFAFERQIDPNHLDKPINPQNVKVKSVDFNRALDEVVPNFGVSGPEFDNCLRNGMLHYGPTFDKLMQTGLSFINQVKNSEHTHILTILLEGIPGTGKTALAASLALKSDFPFIKLISPEQFIGYTESAKVSALRAVFENAYKSPLSMIVIDDIERLLEFVRIGPRFSNLVLQALLVLLKKPPPKGRKLLVVGTTSSFDFLQSLEMAEVFGAVVNNPPLSSKEEVARVLNQLNVFNSEAELERAIKGFQLRIPMKRLLLLVEMAKQGDEGSFGQRFQLGLAQFQEKDSYFYV